MKIMRIKHLINTLAVSAAVFMSFGLGTPATAMSSSPMGGMPHEASINLQNCINQHHVVPGSTTKVDTNELEDDNEEPQPLPYFVQFLPSTISKLQHPPKDIVLSSSYQPPDIVRLTGNIRF